MASQRFPFDVFSLLKSIRMKRIFTLVLPLFVFSMLVAHEYWIAPLAYKVKSGESFLLNCYVGEDFKPEVWQRRIERTGKVRLLHNKADLDITRLFTAADSVDIVLPVPETGNHLLALQSNPSYIELKADEFNQYLEEDGIEDVLLYRKNNGLSRQPSRELYERCAKCLLQVGENTDDSYRQLTGMPLEIIPLEHPVLAREGLPVLILFKGQPLQHYRIRSWCKVNGQLLEKENHRTNEKGICRIPVDRKGEWMISLVKMEVLKNNPRADYHSYWGSYTFYR